MGLRDWVCPRFHPSSVVRRQRLALAAFVKLGRDRDFAQQLQPKSKIKPWSSESHSEIWRDLLLALSSTVHDFDDRL